MCWGWKPMPMKRAVRYRKPGMLVTMRKASGGVKGPLLCRTRVEEAVGEDLHSLGFADGGFAIVLDGSEIVYGGTAGEEALGEDVGGGDCVL